MSGHTGHSATLPTVDRLDDLVRLVEAEDSGSGLYVRWSSGPDVDLSSGQESTDSLTGVPLPGLSVNPLAVEVWWQGHPVRLWVARKLYDYRHLRELRGPDTRPWLLRGAELGRGPDNEPLVTCEEPVAWIGEEVLAESRHLVEGQRSPEWGSLDRRGDTPPPDAPL